MKSYDQKFALAVYSDGDYMFTGYDIGNGCGQCDFTIICFVQGVLYHEIQNM